MAPSVFLVGSSTSVGQVRDLNEDSYGVITEIQQPLGIDSDTIARKGALFAVADGMGGHAAGEVASQMAIELLFSTYYADSDSDPRHSLGRAFEGVNTAIHSQAATDEMQTGMGTTLVAAVLRDGKWWIANVGDSRAYLIRANNIRQVTRDHSWVTEQLAAGVLTEDEARDHPYRNIVTRSMGQKPRIKVDHFELKANPGNRLLLCSDGLSNMVGAEAMEGMIRSQDVDVAAKLLVAEANSAGGPDNITAIVVESQGIQKKPGWLPFAVAGAIVAMIIGIAILWGIISKPPERVAIVVPTQTSTATPDTVVVATSTTPEVPTVTLAPTHTPTPIPTETPTPTPTPAIFIQKKVAFRPVELKGENGVAEIKKVCDQQICAFYLQGQLGEPKPVHDGDGSYSYDLRYKYHKGNEYSYKIYVQDQLESSLLNQVVGILAVPREGADKNDELDALLIAQLSTSTVPVQCNQGSGEQIYLLESYVGEQLLYPDDVKLPSEHIWVFGYANAHSLGDMAGLLFCEDMDRRAAVWGIWRNDVDRGIIFKIGDPFMKNRCLEGEKRIFRTFLDQYEYLVGDCHTTIEQAKIE